MQNSDKSLIIPARKIKIFAFDVDGVMTNGNLFFSDTGESLKQFSVLDGQGIKLLHEYGIKTAIITKRKSAIVKMRAQELNITFVYQQCENKLQTLSELCQTTKVELSNIAYLGDDLPDLPIITRVGLGLCVSNAHSIIKQHALATTVQTGGNGAIREVCDFILSAQNHMEEIIAKFIQ